MNCEEIDIELVLIFYEPDFFNHEELKLVSL